MKIEVDSHTHTIASGHAYSTLEENIQAAVKNNLKVIAFTEHGPEMPGGPHPWFFQNLRVVPRFMHNIAVLRGAEANILNASGQLDVTPDITEQLDIVLGSLHEPLFAPASERDNTRAVINAIESGAIDIFAHGGNPAFPIDYRAVAQAAADCKVLIEINNSSFTTSRPGSKVNCGTLARAVIDCGGNLVFGSDAHIACRVGVFDECQEFARNHELPEERILNTDARRFLYFLKERGRAGVADFLAETS